MKLFYSLKYRIALTIFVIQLVIVTILLWQTQTSAFNRAQDLMRAQDESVIKILSSVSQAALFNEGYFEIQPFYTQVVKEPHVLSAYLTDYQGLVVVSSNSSILGATDPINSNDDNSYWVSSSFEEGDESIGDLYLQFSLAEINSSYDESLQQSVVLGLLGIFVTALLSIIMGHILTKKLEHIHERTERFAVGELDLRCDVSGNDELSSLSISLNTMADQLSNSINEIKHLAYHDALTGLANRREFDKRLESAFSAAKENGHFYALLFLDLDKFKVVNDTCGHHAGDQLLVQLSDVMLLVLRKRDTLVRFGGDEFGVLLENCSLSEAEEVASKLLNAVYEFKFLWEEKVVQVGVSIGVVTLDSHTSNLEHLLSSADAACYAAKQKGRNQIHSVLPGDKAIEGHFADVDWINRLATMIEKDLFKIAYQKITATDGSYHYAEFLLRMTDENDQEVSPAEFINAAERFDFIQRLDRYVIDKVFSAIAQGKIPSNPDKYFINLSGKSISDDKLYNYVKEKIEHYGLNAKNICFEITETAAIANFNHASVFLEKIRELGCSFALDDFGSGMCSFNYLKNLQVDFVKIDGAFILNMSKNEVDKTIVESINLICHKAGFKTIAEFVESDSILEDVTNMGIDFAQGYGIHKPTIIE